MSAMTGTHIQVINDDPSENPHCEAHGPALRMVQTFDDGSADQAFFACSANRDRSKCSIRHNATIPDETVLAERYSIRITQHRRTLKEVLSLAPSQRGFCGQCACLVLPDAFAIHRSHRSFTCGLPDDSLLCPTQILVPLDNDSKEAQYFFNEMTLKCVEQVFQSLGIQKVICMGAPRLHEYLRFNKKRLHIASVLLDLDQRLEQFYERDEFFLYNMFNNHFMDGKGREAEFLQFLNGVCEGKILLFTDPPFGCRTEPLALTIKSIANKYQTRNSLAHALMPCMWIFPYFMETYIHQVMPEMQMASYRVNYTNHRTYHSTLDQGGRKQGSPIRIFTNIPLDKIPLPADEGYTKCVPCQKWRAHDDRHCSKCADCPSKNGATYVHCDECAMCVKPNYKHCAKCGRCTQVTGHSCLDYVKHVTCWICLRKGHNESGCTNWLDGGGSKVLRKRIAKKQVKGRMCMLCGARGHNERRCSKRGEMLRERTFMQEVFNMFSD